MAYLVISFKQSYHLSQTTKIVLYFASTAFLTLLSTSIAIAVAITVVGE
jgi:hypothetical protein